MFTARDIARLQVERYGLPEPRWIAAPEPVLRSYCPNNIRHVIRKHGPVTVIRRQGV